MRRIGGVCGVRRDLAWGAAAAVLYLAAAFAHGTPAFRPLLYDGLVPLPPYQWVRGPGAGSNENPPPPSAAATLTLGPQGSNAAEVSTDDQQATVTFPQGAVPSRPGETSIKVTITPLDPATVAPAPRGRRFDSNAYRVEATDAGSGAPVALAKPVDIVLRYAVHATVVLAFENHAWTALETTVYSGTQDVVAHTDRLGVFAASP